MKEIEEENSMCCCENKESTYWYKYGYQDFVEGAVHPLGKWVIKYDEGFITTDNFQVWWENYKDKHDKLESVVKL